MYLSCQILMHLLIYVNISGIPEPFTLSLAKLDNLGYYWAHRSLRLWY